MMLPVGRRAVEEGYNLILLHQGTTHHFVTCVIYPCKREVVYVFNGSDSLSVDCHVRELGTINSLLSVPVHCKD